MAEESAPGQAVTLAVVKATMEERFRSLRERIDDQEEAQAQRSDKLERILEGHAKDRDILTVKIAEVGSALSLAAMSLKSTADMVQARGPLLQDLCTRVATTETVVKAHAEAIVSLQARDRTNNLLTTIVGAISAVIGSWFAFGKK